MSVSELKEKVGRLIKTVDTFANLSGEDRELQERDFLKKLRTENKELYQKILELPDEEDRNELFDLIIRAFRDAGIVASAFKALVDILG